jgi:hypothetical protein
MPYNLFYFKIASFFKKIYIFLINIINWHGLFFYVPKMAGTYEVRYGSIDSKPEETVFVEQFLSFLNGEIIDHNIHQKFIFSGYVTPSRIISYKLWPVDPNLNNHGVGLLKLNDSVTVAEGYTIYLDDITGKSEPQKLYVIKIS